MRNFLPEIQMLDDANALAVGIQTPVEDWTDKFLTLASSGLDSDSFTIKVRGSNQSDVDLSVASSPTNRWAYIDLLTKDGNSTIAGSTGVDITTNTVSMVKIASDDVRFVAIEIAARTDANASGLINAFLALSNVN